MTEMVKKAKAPAKPKKAATKKAEEVKMANSYHTIRSRNSHRNPGLSEAGRMDTQSRIGFVLSKSYGYRPLERISKTKQEGQYPMRASED